MTKKVLIVDDDCNFVQKLMNSGNNNAVFSIADSIKRANDLLLIDKFDLIIANSKVPGGSSLILKENITKETQILFVSGIDSEYNRIKESGEVCYKKYEMNNKFEAIFTDA
jgi:DNA-binding response OmpR family regulator